MPWNLPTQLMNLTLLTGVGSAGLAAATYAWRRSLPLPAQLALAHTAAAGFAVSAASTQRLAAQSTGLFGKREDGSIPWWRWLLFWPFHTAVAAVMAGYRLLSSEPLFSRVADGWYLGGAPTHASQLPGGPAPALLDVTCEVPRYADAPAYKLLPSWETHGLTPEQIQDGVQWALAQRKADRAVASYCTHGHGRSAVLMCALLLAAGEVGSVEEARSRVKAARPGAEPNKRQWAALEHWHQRYGTGGRGGGGSRGMQG